MESENRERVFTGYEPNVNNEEGAEDGEEEAAEDDMEVDVDDPLPAGVSARLPAPVRAAVTSALTDDPFAAHSAPTAPQAFSGRSFRLA